MTKTSVARGIAMAQIAGGQQNVVVHLEEGHGQRQTLLPLEESGANAIGRAAHNHRENEPDRGG